MAFRPTRAPPPLYANRCDIGTLRGRLYRDSHSPRAISGREKIPPSPGGSPMGSRRSTGRRRRAGLRAQGSDVAQAGEGAQVAALFGRVELALAVLGDAAVRARVRRLDARARTAPRARPRRRSGACGSRSVRAATGAAGGGPTLTAPASTSAKIAWQTSSTGRFVLRTRSRTLRRPSSETIELPALAVDGQLLDAELVGEADPAVERRDDGLDLAPLLDQASRARRSRPRGRRSPRTPTAAPRDRTGTCRRRRAPPRSTRR